MSRFGICCKLLVVMLHRKIRNILTVVLAGTFGLLLSGACFADIDTPIEFKLPQQSVSKTIITVGKSSNITIVMPSHLLRKKSHKPIEGSFTPRELLTKLLKNTNTTFKVINSKVVAIVPQKSAKNDAQDIKELEELVIIGRQVTGSFLDRVDLQGSSPVDIITEHEFDLSGSQSVAEFLKFIPSVSGNSTSTAISNGGDGTATVTLRGLPANNTLVLLNGKRIAAEGIDGDSVDLNSIPSAAVERIEILKDGASSIYGTDAIAGVVNIILKREFDGFQLEQYFGNSYKNDIDTSSTHFLWGKTGTRYSFLLSGQVFEQNGLFSRDRRLSSNADSRPLGGSDERSSATSNTRFISPFFVGSIIPEDDYRQGLEPGVILREGEDGRDLDDFRPADDEIDRFNYYSQTSTISPSMRESLYLSGNIEISDSMNLGLDASHNQTEATITLAATPIFTAFENRPLTIAADNIYNVFAVDIEDARRRVLEAGPREQHNRTRANRVSVTLDGFLADAHWELNSNWNKTYAHEKSTNLLDELRVQRALGSSRHCQGIDVDGCEPLDLFGPSGAITQTQLDYLLTDERITGYTELYGINGNISGGLFTIPSGEIQAATGFDIRKEKIESSSTNKTGAIGSNLRGETFGERDIQEAFFETQIPLLRNTFATYSLDVELSARYSDYSDFGSNSSPKLGIRYRPSPELLLRSTYSEGFRAPNLGELYTGSFQSQQPIEDPCAQDNHADLPGCNGQSSASRIQVLTTFAGEPNLKPETSESYTVGLVWTPERYDLHFSLDHFNIQQKNIVSADANLILVENARTGAFSDFVTRNDNGDITNFFVPFINIGERDISGIDVALQLRNKTEQHGSFIYTLNTSYLDKYNTQLSDNTQQEKFAGTFHDASRQGSGALPRWKANSGLFWSLGRYTFNYSLNYISDMTETITFSGGQQRTIKSWVTHDTQFTYTAGRKKNIKFTLGIDNIWNNEPPFSSAAFNDNYDARTYDIKGQFIYGILTLDF